MCYFILLQANAHKRSKIEKYLAFLSPWRPAERVYDTVIRFIIQRNRYLEAPRHASLGGTCIFHPPHEQRSNAV